MSTSQAFITAEASWSSSRANSRCSSVAYSCFRWLANATARWSDSSRLRENDGKCGLSILFHSALKRVLMTASRIDYLGDLRLGDFIGKYATDPDAMLVDMQHDHRRILPRLVEKALEHVDDEFH